MVIGGALIQHRAIAMEAVDSQAAAVSLGRGWLGLFQGSASEENQAGGSRDNSLAHRT